MYARLAQSVEHETLNLRVVGSSPTLGEKNFEEFFDPERTNRYFVKILIYTKRFHYNDPFIRCTNGLFYLLDFISYI